MLKLAYVTGVLQTSSGWLWVVVVLQAAERSHRVDATEVTPPFLPDGFWFSDFPSLVSVSKSGLSICVRMGGGYWGCLPFSPSLHQPPLSPWSSLFECSPFSAWHMVPLPLALTSPHPWGGELHREKGSPGNTHSCTPPPSLGLHTALSPRMTVGLRLPAWI